MHIDPILEVIQKIVTMNNNKFVVPPTSGGDCTGSSRHCIQIKSFLESLKIVNNRRIGIFYTLQKILHQIKDYPEESLADEKR